MINKECTLLKTSFKYLKIHILGRDLRGVRMGGEFNNNKKTLNLHSIEKDRNASTKKEKLFKTHFLKIKALNHYTLNAIKLEL